METRIYVKEINGSVVKKPGFKIVIDSKIFNPTHETLLDNGWTLYEEPEITYDEVLQDTKMSKIIEIEAYDNSDAVNNCYIVYQGNSIPCWLTKSERTDLKQAIIDFKNNGNNNYRLDLREYGICLYFPCDELLAMLAALEVYAIKCYNTTTDHIFGINSMNNIEDIKAYDYTVGYPDKLYFEYYES
jgi:hypothetical protein